MKTSHPFLTFVLLICSLSSAFFVLTTHANDTKGVVVVSTKQGKLAGTRHLSRGGKSYGAFKGIPYGQVVTRFEPAIPAKSWEGIRDASEHGPLCPQFDRSTQTVVGSEDCLVLNVFAPLKNKKPAHDEDNDERYPVLVFIHGGAYQFGTGADYGGKYLVDEETIFVTINYRLGALGFLSTGDGSIQGNAGLKDQTLALRWIKDNIGSFGGDPSRVALFGTSGGGACVSFQILSPYSSGLFHRAQTISGSALNPWSIHPNPKQAAEELAENLDCPSPKDDSKAFAECLRGMDFRKIVQIRLNVSTEEWDIQLRKWYVDPLCQFGPVVETLRPGQSVNDVFLAEEPLTLLEEGRFNKVPVIMGVAQDEGLLFHAAGIMKDAELQRNMNEDWNRVAPITFLYDHLITPETTEELTDISRTIRGFYFGGRPVGMKTFQNLTNLYSNRYFNHGVRKSALLMAKYTPVYPFILGYQADWSILNLYYGDAYKEPLGVSHGDDMRLIFNSIRFPPIKSGSDIEKFSIQLVKLYASFAKTGNLMETMNMEDWKTAWLPIGPDEVRGTSKLKWFLMDLPPKIIPDPWVEHIKFWDKIEAQMTSIKEQIMISGGTKKGSSSSGTTEEL